MIYDGIPKRVFGTVLVICIFPFGKTNLLLYPPKTIYFHFIPNIKKPEMIYRIESDDRANKNAGQDFLCCDNLHILSCISFLAAVFFLHKKYFYKYKIGVFC